VAHRGFGEAVPRRDRLRWVRLQPDLPPGLHHHSHRHRDLVRRFQKLQALGGEQLAKVLDFRGLFQAPAAAFIQISINHTIHHRGQLTMYLRPMGAKVPSIYGESYDATQDRLAREGKPK
jgi:uncharacterized damage-inducible protein DinB